MKTFFFLLIALTAVVVANAQTASSPACGDLASSCTATGAYSWKMPAGVPPGYEALSFGTAMVFSIDVPPGVYVVTLSFLEPNLTGTSQRLFSVTVNDAAFLPTLAIGAAQLDVPLDRSGVFIASGGKLVIKLTTINGKNVVLSRIGIDRILPGFQATGRFSDGEIPAGPADGVNQNFQLAHMPDPVQSIEVFVDGKPSSDWQYFETPSAPLDPRPNDPASDTTTAVFNPTLSFSSPPAKGSVIKVYYQYGK